jgi:hypothetical protein
MMFGNKIDGFATIRALRNHFDVVSRRKNRDESFADDRMIIDYNDTNWRHEVIAEKVLGGCVRLLRLRVERHYKLDASSPSSVAVDRQRSTKKATPLVHSSESEPTRTRRIDIESDAVVLYSQSDASWFDRQRD